MQNEGQKTLSILQKQKGSWVMFRDANLLAVVEQ